MARMIFAEKKIDALLTQCRLGAAATALALTDENAASERALRRRGQAFVHALAGNDRGIAANAPPQLLACRDAAAAAEYLGAIDHCSEADVLTAAVVLAWTSDAAPAYEYFAIAHERAIAARRFYMVAAAKERLAHHALLFGDLETAAAAVDDAVEVCVANGLSGWFARTLSASARIALDAGEFERVGALLERARREIREPSGLTVFAGTGAQLAVEQADGTALRGWLGDEVLEVALCGDDDTDVAGAAVAVLAGSGVLPPTAPFSAIVRRALLRAQSAASEPELFALAARYAPLEEASFAAASLRAVVAPDRRYLKAHQLLARAHVNFRSGEENGWIDDAGDAAREFNAMGLRRWTNEAMLLLVRREREPQRSERRGRASGSALTGREQQVANLIRRGARNREVALALQISEHTVERHVSSILGRLGLRSRWQIVDPGKSNEP